MIRRHLGAYLSCLAVGLSLALLLSVAIAPASAGSVLISVSGFDPENPADPNTSMSMDYPVAVNADDTFYYSGGFGDDTTPWELEILHLSGDIDPFTDLNFTMKNNTAVTLQYIVSITLPTGPLGPTTLHGGSAGGSVTDANFSALGATLSTIGGGVPFYRGVYDGVLQLPIYPDPSSFTAPTGGTTNIPALIVGLTAGYPTIPAGPVLATIGIVHEFSLTAGDSMSATSNFRVEIIPEPAACVLAICGLFATAGLRRRS